MKVGDIFDEDALIDAQAKKLSAEIFNAILIHFGVKYGDISSKHDVVVSIKALNAVYASLFCAVKTEGIPIFLDMLFDSIHKAQAEYPDF